MPNKIRYAKGYKYQLRETVNILTNVRPPKDIHTDLVSLLNTGVLVVRKYFAWDGCSGPTIDTKTNMRAGLVHDALYYLMRAGLLDPCLKDDADQELRRLMIEDGDFKWRADYYYWAVKHFAHSATKNRRDIIEAPCWPA